MVGVKNCHHQKGSIEVKTNYMYVNNVQCHQKGSLEAKIIYVCIYNVYGQFLCWLCKYLYLGNHGMLSFIQCTQDFELHSMYPRHWASFNVLKLLRNRFLYLFWKKYYKITTWGVISLVLIYKQYTAQDDTKNV